ncbi:leucine-rich repeat domain-containing protein [Archangium gephyra]|nr:leucine-rich repeat domain-containing protein [Archangium gephyra]
MRLDRHWFIRAATPLFLGVMGLSGCSEAPGNPAATTMDVFGTTEQDVRVTPAQMVGAALLGTGFSVEDESFRGQCLQGTVAYSGAAMSDASLVLVDSYERIKSDLGINISGKATFATWDLNAAAHFAMNAAETLNSSSMTFRYQVRGRNAMLVDAVPTARALEARTRGSEAVKQMCGTEFIQQVELGAGLWVNVRYDFLDQAAKSQFSADVKVNILKLFSGSGGVTLVDDRLKKSASITVSALQVGGDPTKLSSIFSTTCQDEASQPTGGGTPGTAGPPRRCIAALSCSLERPQDCQAALERIVTYAAEEFPAQLQDLRYDPTSASGAAIMAYITQGYKTGGFYDLLNEDSPLVEVAVINARAQLHARLLQLVSDSQRVVQLLSPSFRLTSEERIGYESIQSRISTQINMLVAAANICYTRLSDCVGEVARFDLAIQTPELRYDRDALAKVPTFYEYCSGLATADDTKKTVTVMREKLGATGFTCDEAALYLEQEEALDLSGQGLVDLRPLRGAKNLRYLYLRDNALVNILPLGDLPLLRTLDFRHNSVRSLGAVANLKRLERLTASYNQVMSVDSLAAHPTLQEVRLLNNPIVDVAPLSTIPNLKLLVVTLDDVCKVERKWLLDNGRITASIHDIYERRNFGPTYATPGNRNTAITGWFMCSAVASSLTEAQ